MTLSLVSGSMAKFVHTTQGSDTARVAQFELVVQSYDLRDGSTDATVWGTPDTAINLFSTTTDDTGLYNDPAGDFDTNDGVKLVAPGTTGQFSINVSNNSEVAVKPTFALTETFVNDQKIPIVYTYQDSHYTSYADSGLSVGGKHISGDLTALAAALTNRIGPMDPQMTMPLGGVSDQTITWSWAFTSNDNQTDAKDTVLAIDNNLNGLDQPTITLTLSCLAEQLDTGAAG